jgi:hypothetical protein
MLGEDAPDVLGWARKAIRNGQLQGGQVVGTIPSASLPAHASTHQNGGSDEIDVTGLTGAGGSLTVKEEDGAPSVAGVTEIKVTNGSLTDNTGGSVSIALSASDSAAIHDNAASEIHAVTEKATPVDADEILIEDSADSYNKKRVQIGNLPGGSGGATIHTSAYASPPASPASGDLWLPSDSYVALRYSGSVWMPWGPIVPLKMPVDGDFAWINQGGASVTALSTGGIRMVGTTGTAIRIRKKAAPSPPYTVTALFLNACASTNYLKFGLCWRQSSDGKLVLMTAVYNGGWKVQASKSADTAFTGFADYVAATAVADGYVSRGIYLRLEDDNTNRKCYYSFDGLKWTLFHSVGRTDYLTADEVGFWCDGTSSGTAPDFTVLSWKEA